MIRPSLLAAVLLLLAACGGLPERPPVDSPELVWQERQQQLQQLAHWQLKGRVAVINGVEAWHLNIDWLQQADSYHINLWGPFGSGRVRLQGDQHGVLLIDADQAVYAASDPESLLYQHTGVHMPVAGLRYWILGLADPGRDTRQPRLDQYGRLASLEQNDWQIQISRYVFAGAHELPRNLAVSKHEVKVRMVVDDWQLDAVD